MSLTPSPGQSDIQTVLRAFLLSILPAGVEVVEGLDNRVPEPLGDFVTMTVLRRERLSTNIDTWQDCAFQASIAGTVMTVTQMFLGQIVLGHALLGPNVLAGTTVTAFGSGSGGIGTYTLSQAQTIASQKMATGIETIMQPTRIAIQLDVHSASDATASDMAQTIATLFRDDYAATFFAASNASVMPLHADEPRLVPFINAEQQFETRYVIEAVLQANQALTPSEAFADQLNVGLIEVDTAYPA